MASTQVLAGFHAVVARLRHAPDSIKEIYVEASRRDKRMQTFIEQAERAGCRLHPVGMERLDGLARGTRHQGVVALAEERQLAVDVDEVLDDRRAAAAADPGRRDRSAQPAPACARPTRPACTR